jgi:N-acetylmuramic acid 6-phosphate etherase
MSRSKQPSIFIEDQSPFIEDQSPEEAAQAFLNVSKHFQVAMLPTEQRHPKTTCLSDLSKNNLPEAISILKEIDLEALGVLSHRMDKILQLQRAISETISSGGRVFLCGCGATGRLSVTLEVLWRQQASPMLRDSVVSFIAGGDVALISSVESFEDSSEFGVRQLKDLGFQKGDLLISNTEGGETPFVIGAVEYAASYSEWRKPFFIYCNPDDALKNRTERTRRVLENEDIEKINLSVGPMAISGSTRMQASTVVLGAIGIALLFEDPEAARQEIIKLIGDSDFLFLGKFIEMESEIYNKSGVIYYETSENLGISVLTDTTERSPTFSLAPFDNSNDQNPLPSLAYLLFSNADSSERAWSQLLLRQPRALDWKEHSERVSLTRLLGFDFSKGIIERRKKTFPNLSPYIFRIIDEGDSLLFALEHLTHRLSWDNASSLARHVFLKVLLNIHSTLVMGRLGRYEGNVMTWVKASNLKLVDRAIRYATTILKDRGINRFTYADVAFEIFRQMKRIGPTESIVLAAVKSLEGHG